MDSYKDTKEEAIKNIKRSDKNRRNYYKTVTNSEWGNLENYDLVVNSKIGVEASAEIICDYIKKIS